MPNKAMAQNAPFTPIGKKTLRVTGTRICVRSCSVERTESFCSTIAAIGAKCGSCSTTNAPTVIMQVITPDERYRQVMRIPDIFPS